MQWYTIAMMLLTLLGMIYMVTSKLRKSTLLRGHLFSYVAKVMLFVLDAQSYVLVKLCRVVWNIHLFKLIGKLTPGSITLKRNFIWDVLDIDLKEVSVTLNGKKINLPTSVTIPFRDKFGIRRLVRKETLLLHVMLKQGRTWFTLDVNDVREKEPVTEIAYAIML